MIYFLHKLTFLLTFDLHQLFKKFLIQKYEGDFFAIFSEF